MPARTGPSPSRRGPATRAWAVAATLLSLCALAAAVPQKKVQDAPPAALPDPGIPGRAPQAAPDQPEDARPDSVEAPVVQWLQVDGDLSDWPSAMPRHSLKKILSGGSLGTSGLEEVDRTTNPDLSACFMVGYDPKKQVLYLGVIVRDDELIVGHKSHLDTDAVELYFDGLHSEKLAPQISGDSPWFKQVSVADMPVQQYIGIPGAGEVYGTGYPTNPVLMAGDLNRTRTRMAFKRKGDTTTYEWAVQVFDKYPDQPTKLEPGKRIGFDIAVADKDVPVHPDSDVLIPGAVPLNEPLADRSTWIYWGPQWRGMKALNAGILGEIVLGH